MATSIAAATMPTMGDDERIQTIVLMRHGVASHNFEGADLYSPSLFDPPLTLQGKMGAVQAGDKIRTWWKTVNQNSMDLILTSPLTRCLQTAMHAFLPGDDYDRGGGGGGGGGWIPVFCIENLREACGKHYPDKRREKSVLQKFWGPMGVQFDESMTETDERWSPTSREGYDELGSRIEAFLKWIVQRPEENIMVVSHGVWIEDFLRRHQPNFLRDRRVYNLDAFGMQCVSQNSTREFLRLENVKIVMIASLEQTHVSRGTIGSLVAS